MYMTYTCVLVFDGFHGGDVYGMQEKEYGDQSSSVRGSPLSLNAGD